MTDASVAELSPASQAGVPLPARGPWIVSARFDLAMLLIPVVLTALVLPIRLPAGTGVPLVAFLGLVVAFDVAHVWATLYLSYLDPVVRARRPWLLLLPLPLVLLAAARLHGHDPTLYWALLAYVAIHHFAAQQWGFVALYKMRAGERGPIDRTLDKLTLWTGALGPVLLVHASPERHFDWFGHGERFLLALDPALKGDIRVVMLGVGVTWLLRQAWHLHRGTIAWAKVMWMAAAWASWSIGLLFAVDQPLVSLAAVNLLHGIPFLGLVWIRLRKRVEPAPGAPPAPSILARVAARPWLFLAPLVLLALLEEGLWDGIVWRNYLPEVLGVTAWPAPGEPWLSLTVALLALPQTVHYLLDAYLWRMDGSNPDLDALLGVRRGS